MAFFKFRKGGDDASAIPRQPESVEAMRKRAKHRLLGAVVLVLIGVVGFPLLFDTQPRPVAVDIPIDIPDRNKAKPLTAPSTPLKPAAQAQAVSGPVTLPEPEKKPEAAAQKAPEKPADKPAEKLAEKASEPTPVPKATPKPAASVAAATPVIAPPKADDGAKARAQLEGKPVQPASAQTASAPAEGRFVVQVGAFADATKAREARQKLERAGLKTYTQVAETKDGKRIRVRVGPFGSKAEADKAAGKIKELDLPAAILTL